MKLFIIFFLLVATVANYSQSTSAVIDKSKLNGIWVFDFKASKGESETKERYKNQDLTISYSEPELKIIEPRTREGETRYATLVFFTDGRGEITKPYAFNQNAEIKSVTNWENNILIRKYAILLNIKGKTFDGNRYVEKYSLSMDGSTLTITTESKMDPNTTRALMGDSSSSGTSKIVRVYQRKL